MQIDQERPAWMMKTAHIFKRIFALFIVIAMVLGINQGLRYILIDDTSSYTRLTMHEFYNQDNIDVLFVGASHSYRAFMTSVFDERLGVNSFCIGSSRQPLDVSYALIQEAVERYDLKEVYLEMSFTIARSSKVNRSEDLTDVYIVSDYLRPSMRKVNLLTKSTAPECYANSFLLARRNWDKLLDREYIGNVLQKKSTDAYKNYEYMDNYAGKGFIAGDETVEENPFDTAGYSSINVDTMPDLWSEILFQIIDYCKKNDVKLRLVATPVSTYFTAGRGNYDDYIEKVKELIEGTGIEYYDFNLCREEYFPDTNTLFQDNNHLNAEGAEIFSNLVVDLVTGKVTQEEMFYQSCAEKLSNLPPKVYGLSYKEIKDSSTKEKVRRVKVVSNRYEGMEYRIQITPKDGEKYLVQDFAKERYFEISPEEHGVCTVTFRMSGDPTHESEVNIAF